MAKIGRNDPCPCGSGKKYKRCHGSIEALDRISHVMAQAPLMRARAEAAQAQRQRQQGLGKAIIATEVNGRRFVAVKNRLLYSNKWKTFHDFLFDYIKMVIGADWGNAQLQKPIEQRHPILVWYQRACEYQCTFITEPGKVSSGSMTGAIAAYLHLAYDLYALDHAVELQSTLVARLRNHDNFAGARYEVRVAATLLRAGFELELEDEADGSTTHVEFTATSKKTGKKFSVEAKQRDAKRIRVNRLLNRALTKNAPHARVIFIDINEPDAANDQSMPQFLTHALNRLRLYERDPSAAGLSPAYVFVTNTPWQFGLDSKDFRCSALAHGFRIPEFEMGHVFGSIRDAVEAREVHIEMHELLQSMREHANIPSTFDGEIPEFALGDTPSRLVVGERLVVPDESGVERAGVLESAVVAEPNNNAHCVVRLDDERRVIVSVPLTEQEIQAWRRHPDTFFGVVDRNTKHAESALDWYDFFYGSYRHTPREMLLEFMATSQDREHLATLDQPELARIYAERMAAHVLRDEAVRNKPRAATT